MRREATMGTTISVLQDLERYENKHNCIGIQELIAMGEEDVSKGNVFTHEEVFTSLELKLSRAAG